MALPAQIARIANVFTGVIIARRVTVITTAVSLCEYFSCLDQEVKYFWSGEWTSSRILFLLNRYFSLAVQLFDIIFPLIKMSPGLCGSLVETGFYLNVMGIAIIQAILVLRVWYLFAYSARIRIFVVVSYLLANTLAMFFVYQRSRDIRPFVRSSGTCLVRSLKKFWTVYLPGLYLHTILYILTAYRALRNRRLLKKTPILRRLVLDGGIFYFAVFCTSGFSTVAAMFMGTPAVNFTAVFSHLMLGVTSICISRIMLATHSLASNLGSETGWALNNTELSRVNWKLGSHEGEMIVDLGGSDEEEYGNDQKGYDNIGQITMTRVANVGIFDEGAVDWEGLRRCL